jgi:hypothetical protein
MALVLKGVAIPYAVQSAFLTPSEGAGAGPVQVPTQAPASAAPTPAALEARTQEMEKELASIKSDLAGYSSDHGSVAVDE